VETSRRCQGGDGRKVALLKFYCGHRDVKKGLIKGNHDGVLRIIDEFASTVKRPPCLGREKGKFISDILDSPSSPRPQSIVECGTYVGYSAIMLGAKLKRRGGEHLFTFEPNIRFATIARTLITQAGLDGIVKVVGGWPTRSKLRDMAEKNGRTYKADIVLSQRVFAQALYLVLRVIWSGQPRYRLFDGHTCSE
jgi:predicted O-methyltransferase YrrM